MGNEHSSADIMEAEEALNDDVHGTRVQYDVQNEPKHDLQNELDGVESDDDEDVDANAFFGFRVLGIQEESPASRVGFVSFFDFILAANGIRLDTRDSTFMELIAQSEDQPMQLDVYNIKSQTTRRLELTPSRRWAGKGLLGVTIRFDSYEHAEDQLVHILHVAKHSPAFKAGLHTGSDYLLGTPERVFRDVDDLYEEVSEAIGDHFQSYVYNAEDDQVRIVRIEPSEHWGGPGVLGAEVGHGVLHRLPSACRSTIGTSMGFVSLSDEAKPATDPYLRQRQHEADAASQEPQQEPAQDTVIAVDDVSITNEPAVVEPEPQTTETTTTTSSTMDVAVPEAPTSQTQSTTVTPPTSRLRYAPRIDPRFPISTIEVLADPAQIN